VTWSIRYLLGAVAAASLVLSALLAGHQAATAGAKGPGVLHTSAKASTMILASSSLSSEQAALAELQRRLADAAAQAQAQQAAQLTQLAALVKLANARASVTTLPRASSSTTTLVGSGPGERALAAAEAQIGKPYRYGGSGPNGFDCSGLTMFAWRAAGVSLTHGATQQYPETTHISLSSLQPGDLLFWGSGSYMGHVAMYVSPGRMIEAEDSGSVVGIHPIRYSGLVGAGRPH
jgi:peptidoglycan DL-endopeptidase CwlO